MSDEQTEQELDAAVIANYRAWCAEFDTIEAADWSFALDLRLEELRVLLGDGSDTFADSAIRTIDRLTAERDAARAEVERLRAACAGISEGLIRTATHGVENLTKRDWLIQTAQNITAALETRGIR